MKEDIVHTVVLMHAYDVDIIVPVQLQLYTVHWNNSMYKRSILKHAVQQNV